MVRHGQTEWNLSGKMQGILDSDLTDSGIEHAKIIGEKLKCHKITKVYSSDLGRAFSTSEYINKFIDVEIIKDERLRERNMGIFAGYDWKYVKKNFPDEYQSTLYGDESYVIPNGESRICFYNKVTSFKSFIEKNYSKSGENILVVTHGGFIKFFLKSVIGIPLETKNTFHVKNCSLVTFNCENNNWALESFGDI